MFGINNGRVTEVGSSAARAGGLERADVSKVLGVCSHECPLW